MLPLSSHPKDVVPLHVRSVNTKLGFGINFWRYNSVPLREVITVRPANLESTESGDRLTRRGTFNIECR